jgi:TonB family protein
MATDMNSFLPAILRVTVFLAVAGLLSLALLRRTAAVRHIVWTSALAGALAIPFLSGALPRWTIPVWTDLLPAQVVVASSAPLSATAVSLATARDWKPAVFAIWWTGVLAVLLQTLLGAVAVIRLKQRAQPAPARVASLALELSLEMGLDKEIQVLTTEDATTPMTWGVFRPVVLLPAVVAGGDPDRLRAVLLHELAHVARRDYLLHLLAQAACAIYWFHPLVWLARREALRMRERASDDMVLGFGVQPADYASSLVQLSRSLAAPRLCASLGITRCSNLEKRVRAILDPDLRRGRLTPAWALLAVVAAGALALAVGAMQPTLAEIPSLPLLAPVQSGVYSVGSGVTAPSVIFKAEPEYSQEARDMKIEGTVVLRIVVGVDGVPEDISVLRSLGLGLDEKAVESIGKWRFKPGMKDGVPVPVAAQVEVNFRLLHYANPNASEAYRVGNGVAAPALIFRVEPGYSEEALTMKIEGKVILQVVVAEDGVPGNIRITSPLGHGLDEKAVDAVSQWRFRPGMKEGVPVPVSAQVEVNFRLQ